MRCIGRCLPPLFLALCSFQLAQAQSSFDLNLGFGAVQDKAPSTGLDPNFLSCSGPVAGSSTCSPINKLNAFFMGFGGSMMLWKHFGVGAQYTLQPARQTYSDLSGVQAGYSLQSRFGLYGFDGLWQPVSKKKVAFRLAGGIGGANLKFYQHLSGSNAVIGNYNQSQYAGSSNHFAVHGAASVQIFVTEHIFVRPEFNVYYVNNLGQYGSNLVKSELVWVGYSWGDR